MEIRQHLLRFPVSPTYDTHWCTTLVGNGRTTQKSKLPNPAAMEQAWEADLDQAVEADATISSKQDQAQEGSTSMAGVKDGLDEAKPRTCWCSCRRCELAS